MIARGVEQADLDYTLELVMSNGSAREGLQAALIELLIEPARPPRRRRILVALAHGAWSRSSCCSRAASR